MKMKSLCLITATTLLLSVSVNVFANCGSCEKAKPSCGKKLSECGKKQSAQKVEKKAAKKAELGEDKDIPLSEVPEKIKKLAEKAVKGIKLTEAEIEGGNYELEGYAGKDKYEIKITPEGKIIEVDVDKKDDDDLIIDKGAGTLDMEVIDND